jgi:hypothetical protein
MKTRNGLIHLELFSGTKSWGKVTSRHGMDVISVDIEDTYNPTIVSDILKLDYKKLPTPDLITASPPCNSFSILARSNLSRDWYSLEALRENAKLGNKILKKTLDIIRYFKKKNPNMLFVIENPRAMMARAPVMSGIPKQTTEYCLYGFDWRKPTDLWHNFPGLLNLKNPRTTPTPCDPSRLIPVIKQPLSERYKIPPRLVKDIVSAFFRDYGKDPLPVALSPSPPIKLCRPSKKISPNK